MIITKLILQKTEETLDPQSIPGVNQRLKNLGQIINQENLNI